MRRFQYRPSTQAARLPVTVAARPLPWFILGCIVALASALIKPAHASLSFNVDAVSIQHSVSVPPIDIGYSLANSRDAYQNANHAYDEGEVYLAFRLWSALAEQGHADAAFKLGMLYDRGEVVEHDASRAAYWYKQAAQSGNALAQHNLGVAYANGDGVEINMEAAMEWWIKAAQQGNVDSQYNLGIVYAMGSHGYQRDTIKAAQWWRRAANKGDAMAQYNLGALYANGDKAVRDVCEALHWLSQSAAHGIPQATQVLEAVKSQREAGTCR
ncbi:MAG: sel1 repeat family protein [Gammaproteobacteria bacterium]|nr:sel1 repeat family protein [Gammaproteobacteria bacterium]